MTAKIHIAWLPRVRGGPDEAAASGSACEGASLWFGPSAASWLGSPSLFSQRAGVVKERPLGPHAQGEKVQARALAAGCYWDPDPLRLVPSPALNVKRRLGGRVTRNWSNWSRENCCIAAYLWPAKMHLVMKPCVSQKPNNWSRETAALQPTCGQPKCILS